MCVPPPPKMTSLPPRPPPPAPPGSPPKLPLIPPSPNSHPSPPRSVTSLSAPPLPPQAPPTNQQTPPPYTLSPAQLTPLILVVLVTAQHGQAAALRHLGLTGKHHRGGSQKNPLRFPPPTQNDARCLPNALRAAFGSPRPSLTASAISSPAASGWPSATSAHLHTHFRLPPRPLPLRFPNLAFRWRMRTERGGGGGEGGATKRKGRGLPGSLSHVTAALPGATALHRRRRRRRRRRAKTPPPPSPPLLPSSPTAAIMEPGETGAGSDVTRTGAWVTSWGRRGSAGGFWA